MIAGRFLHLDERDTGVVKDKIGGIAEIRSYETYFDLGTTSAASRKNIRKRWSNAPCVLSK